MPSSISPYTPRNRDRLVRLAESAGRFVGALRTERHIRQWGQQQRQAADRETRLWELRNAPRAKRALDFSGQVTRSSGAMPINAGATNVIQRAVIKQRSGKRVKRKSVNYLYRLQKAVTSDCVQRFSSMSEYDSRGFNYIGYDAGGAAPALDYLYPVYVFDLTSCLMTANGVRLAAEPFYRLLSNTSGTGNYFWARSIGQDASAVGAGTYEWFTERARGVDSLTNAPSIGNNSMLAWSDIRLALYGATNQTTKFTVSFIQFVDEAYQPRSIMQDPAVPAGLNAATLDQQGRFNAAMTELVKPLVYHPLHVPGNAESVFRVLESRTFYVQPDTQTNEAKAPPNVCYKLFKRMNRICKWNWQTSEKKATTTSTEHKVAPELPRGLDTTPDINQFFGGTKKPYVHPNARVYMMITAQAYTRTGIQPDGSSVAISVVNSPSFDLLVRNKWLYDAV